MVTASTGSGDVQLEGTPSGEWKLTAGSGNVTVHVPSQAAFDLDASTSSGEISLNHPVTVSGTLTRHSVHGKVGTGGSLVEVRTGSGNIEID